MLGSKPVNTPMDPNVQLKGVDDVDFADTRRYRSLVGKLIYLTMTCPDITFVVSVVWQYMKSPKQVHWDAVCHFLTYLKGTVGVDILYKKHTELDIFNSSDAH